MKLHIERTKGHLRIIETKEFMESEPLNIRLIEELEK